MTSTKKLFSWFLILALSLSTLVLAKGEENQDTCNWPAVLENRTLTLYDGSEIKLENTPFKKQLQELHYHKYVSEDGSKEKWICSEESSWDDLKWTAETKPIEEEVFRKIDNYEIPVEEDYYVVYAPFHISAQKSSFSNENNTYGYGKGFDKVKISEDGKVRNLEDEYNKEWHRTPLIVKMTKEEYKMLQDSGLLKFEEMAWGFEEFLVDYSFLANGKNKIIAIDVDIAKDHYLVNEILTDNPYEHMGEYPYFYVMYFVDNAETYEPRIADVKKSSQL